MRISDWSADMCSADLYTFEGCSRDASRDALTDRTVLRMTRFPDDFLWGASTAAYQIEGSPLADGAGASIWRRFTHDPRLMIAKGDTGEVACDHYRRWRDDVALMKALGLQAYRFSIRSEERRVGKECGSTCSYRWSPYHKKKKRNLHQDITKNN